MWQTLIAYLFWWYFGFWWLATILIQKQSFLLNLELTRFVISCAICYASCGLMRNRTRRGWVRWGDVTRLDLLIVSKQLWPCSKKFLFDCYCSTQSFDSNCKTSRVNISTFTWILIFFLIWAPVFCWRILHLKIHTKLHLGTKGRIFHLPYTEWVIH